MDGSTLADRIAKGAGVAARRSGCLYGVYRPSGSIEPLSPRNLKIELFAEFLPGQGAEAGAFGGPLWIGVFDSSYTKTGDFISTESETYFISSQRPALPVQCTITNRIVSLVRPLPASQQGYSGFFANSGLSLLSGWPANIRADSNNGGDGDPGNTRFGNWTVLLPQLPVLPELGDVLSDDLANVYTVGGAEESAMGWRLLVRQVCA